MEKRGDFLVNNLLSVVIAVICVALFIFAASRVLQVRASDEENNARKTIDLIEAKIDALEEGQESEMTIQGFRGADRWYIVGWNENEADRPDKCFFDSCVCICKGASSDSCQERGICTDVEDREVLVHTLPFSWTSGGVAIGEGFSYLSGNEWHKSCIPLQSRLMKIDFLSVNEKVTLVLDSPGDLTSFGGEKDKLVNAYRSCDDVLEEV